MKTFGTLRLIAFAGLVLFLFCEGNDLGKWGAFGKYDHLAADLSGSGMVLFVLIFIAPLVRKTERDLDEGD